MNNFLQAHFKKMYVINLDRRTDRLNEFKNKVKEYFDPQLIEKISAVDGNKIDFSKHRGLFKAKSNGEIGCYLSYCELWNNIINNDEIDDEDLILIFEDDIFINKKFVENFQNAINNFKNINGNKLLYMGGRFNPDFCPNNNILHKWDKISDKLYKRNYFNDVNYERTTHVLVLNKGSCRILYKLSQVKPLPIDKFIHWCELNDNNIEYYDYFPHIFYSPIGYKTDIQ